MFRIILAISVILACYKWGNWKNWKAYYPTILYYIIGDLSYNILFCDKMLWQYDDLFTHTFSDYFSAFFIAPPVIILFLTHFPVRFIHQVPYALCWAGALTLIEYLSVAFGSMIYDYGWNIAGSFGVYCALIPMLRLHYKKPLLVWPISLGMALAMLFLFQIPLESI